MSCLVCKKPLQYRFEGYEETPLRDFIYEHWVRASDWSVCSDHEEALADLLKKMINLGVNPEINPKLRKFENIEGKNYKEWRRRQGEQVTPSVYDSDYTSFALPVEAAKYRRFAIDEYLKFNDIRRKIGRHIIKELDGMFAESFMAGTVSPNSWTVVTAYENAWVIIGAMKYWEI